MKNISKFYSKSSSDLSFIYNTIQVKQKPGNKMKKNSKIKNSHFPLKFKKHQNFKNSQNIDIDVTLGYNFRHGKCKNILKQGEESKIKLLEKNL